jgi:hypothetical protein
VIFGWWSGSGGGIVWCVTDPPLEIACDESGAEGDHLIGGETTVFAYASVRLDTATAVDCVREVRDRIGSPALEYKANHLLRGKSRPVLRWLLGPSGPVHGRAHVHLTDKTFYLVTKIVELLVEGVTGGTGSCPSPRSSAMSTTLYREGRSAFGHGPWHAFLTSFNTLMRVRNRPLVADSVDPFCRMIDVLHSAGAPGRLSEITGLLRQAKPRVRPLVARALDNPDAMVTLDPLIPAFVRTVSYWSAGERAVSITHDQQPALTEEWVIQISEMLDGRRPVSARCPPRARLAGLRFVDSRTDPRVQVADFLAGVARRVATDTLDNQGDADLTPLLRPYLDRHSIWPPPLLVDHELRGMIAMRSCP